MADEVMMAQEVTTPVEEQAVVEKPRRGRKKGTSAKAESTGAKKTVSKTTKKRAEKKTADKTDKVDSAKTKAAKKPQVPELRCKSMTIEFNDKKYTESDLFDRVKAYISTHPYIVAHDIEIFLKPNDSCAYFTIDGFSNPDFRIEL